MKKLFSGICTLALLCGAMLAQATSSPQTSAPQPPQASPNGEPQSTATTSTAGRTTGPQTQPNALKIAPGSVLPAQLSKTVDAKKAKSGDEVVATITQDMKNNAGEVIVPKDTKILGHVTEAQPRNKEQKESQLGITFDHAVVNGNQTSIPMSIQAIIAPPQMNPAAAAGGGGTPEAPSSPNPNANMGGSQAGRSPSGGGSNQSAQQNYPQSNADASGASEQAQNGGRPPITGNTQGVIGMDNVKLENNAQNNTQGSLVTSEKNNVKIEKGTVLLLKVNQ
jgi:hypothetical protein